MKLGREPKDLIEELQRQVQSKKDYNAPTRAMRVAVLDRPNNPVGLNLAGIGGFPLRPLAHKQLAEYTGIPAAYYDRMLREKPELLVDNADAWLAAKNENRFVRTLDGDVRALLSDRYRPLDSWDLVQAAIPAIFETGAKIVSCEVTENRLYLKATTVHMRFQVKVGDVVEAGILVQNSEVGLGRLVVSPFFNRLICSNGAVANEYGQRRTHLGKSIGGDDDLPAEWLRDETREADDRAFFLKTADVVRASLDRAKMEPLVQKMIGAAHRTIDADPVKVVEVTAKRFGFNEQQRGEALKNLVAGADLSQWGLSNAVTAIANTTESYDQATELERQGFAITELSDQDWNKLLKEAA